MAFLFKYSFSFGLEAAKHVWNAFQEVLEKCPMTRRTKAKLSSFPINVPNKEHKVCDDLCISGWFGLERLACGITRRKDVSAWVKTLRQDLFTRNEPKKPFKERVAKRVHHVDLFNHDSQKGQILCAPGQL